MGIRAPSFLAIAAAAGLLVLLPAGEIFSYSRSSFKFIWLSFVSSSRGKKACVMSGIPLKWFENLIALVPSDHCLPLGK